MLASWNTLPIPLRTGHAPAAEALDPDLTACLAESEDLYARQLRLLSWYYARYQRWLPAGQILRYEDLIASRGQTLACITPTARQLYEPLHSRNRNPLYDPELIVMLSARLRQSEGAYWNFYDRPPA
ncbi:MAG: hypothetical protein ACOYMW_16300 [Candidatus Competibacteraceae bacterium]